MNQSTERVITWVCHPDDLDPGYVSAIEAQMSQRWAEPAARAGFAFRFIPANRLVPGCADDRPQLWLDDEDLLLRRHCYIVDDVSPNAHAAQFLRGIYRAIDASDSVLLNRSITGPECLERDKLAILARASTLGVPVPATFVIPFGRYARTGLRTIRARLGDGPYIVKPRESGVGYGVLKVETFEQLRSVADMVAAGGQSYIVQPFLPNDGDLRVAIVQGRVVTSMLRRPAGGAYLSNISQGGTSTARPDYSMVEEQSLRIAADLDAGYLCVDWLLTPGGPVLGEWGTAMAEFSPFPEPSRSDLAKAFFAWAEATLFVKGS
jgi:glutathione synthase/RimK-type ligase-like ATP-grasp enzyme